MKRVEIAYSSKVKEMEKLNARLERAEKAYAKKLAAAEKLGVANMTDEEHGEWLRTVETSDNGWIVNAADAKKNGAWFDMVMAEDNLKEVQEAIEKAQTRFEEAEEALEEHRKEVERIADLKLKEELWKLEWEAEKKEWAKDGIKLEGRYFGITPKGEKFWIERNHGFARRSLYCFSVRVGKDTVFTSGEFWLAYSVVKNS